VSLKRILTPAALVACLALGVAALPATAEAASTQPSLPQPIAAQAGATWLASQFTSQGYIPSSSDPGTADLSSTANAILALASANTEPTVAAKGLAYLEQEANFEAYVTQEGADGPGQLSLLLLDAEALGVSPTSFGGNNLVTDLLGTEQTSGADTGLFGTETQVNDYNAGVYDQGLALAALAGAGHTSGSAVASAESWELSQQCSDGGWTTYENADNPCTGKPKNYEGPDTNSTSLAILGLSAQGDLHAKVATAALGWIETAQDGDGGWGYEPNSTKTPGSTDPDSTALVMQALLALGQSPTGPSFDKGSANPVATEESFQIPSGSNDAGAFTYPGESGANLLTTYQAVPAVAGVVLPFNLFITTSSLPNGSVGTKYHEQLAASGGNAPYTWSVEKGFGKLPAGLTLNASTGVISGKPTSDQTSTFVIEVTDTTTTSSPHHDNVAWAILSITT
jgi:hypothetical protein